MVTKSVTSKASNAKSDTPAVTDAPVVKPRALQKIKWIDETPRVDRDGNPDPKGDCDGVGTCNGNVYAIKRQDDGTWRATHQIEGEPGITVLAEGVASGKVAWRKCVDHHNANYRAPVATTPEVAASA